MRISHGAVSGGSPSANVFMVCSGQVKLSALSKEGRSFTLKIADHGDLLGLSAAVANALYEATAETIGIVQLKVIPRADFLKFIETFDEASRHTASVLAEQHQAAIYDVRRLGLSGSGSAKLAHTLLELKHSANQEPAICVDFSGVAHSRGDGGDDGNLAARRWSTCGAVCATS